MEDQIQQGMALQQSDPINMDIRDIMSEQLTEIRMMREDIKASAPKEGAYSTGLPASENPYIMNPYYTEHHEAAVNNVYQSVNSNYDNLPRSDAETIKGSFNSLTDYMNQTGYFSMLANDNIINGQGYTGKQRDLARFQLGDQVFRDTVGKNSDKVGFGANLLADGVVTGIVSKLGASVIPAMAIGYAGGAVAEYAVREGIEEVEMYQNYRNKLIDKSSTFINDFESDRIGGGLSKGDSKKLAWTLAGMNSKYDISDEEMMEIFDGAMDNDLMDTTSNIKEFEERFGKLTDAVKTSAKTLGKSFREVTDMLGEMQREGIDVGTGNLLLSGTSGIANTMNMDGGDFAMMIAQIAAALTKGSGADTNATALDTQAQFGIIADVKAAIDNKKADQGYESLDYSERAILNMTEQEIYGSLDQLVTNRGKGFSDSILTAAMKTDENGMTSIDRDLVYKYSDDLAAGNISIDEISAIATEKADSLGTNYMSVFAMESKNFMASENMAYKNMQIDVMERLAKEYLAESPNEFGGKAYDDLSKNEQQVLWASASLANFGNEQAGLVAYNFRDEFGDGAKAGQNIEMYLEKGSAASKRQTWWNPFDDNYMVPKYLEEMMLFNEYDYSNISLSDDVVNKSKQGEQVMTSMLFSALDEKTANEYQNRLSANTGGGSIFSKEENAQNNLRRNKDIMVEAFLEGDSDAWADYLEIMSGKEIANQYRSIVSEDFDGDEAKRKEEMKNLLPEIIGSHESAVVDRSVKEKANKNNTSTDDVKDAVAKNTEATSEMIDILLGGFNKNTEAVTSLIDRWQTSHW